MEPDAGTGSAGAGDKLQLLGPLTQRMPEAARASPSLQLRNKLACVSYYLCLEKLVSQSTVPAASHHDITLVHKHVWTSLQDTALRYLHQTQPQATSKGRNQVWGLLGQKASTTHSRSSRRLRSSLHNHHALCRLGTQKFQRTCPEKPSPEMECSPLHGERCLDRGRGVGTATVTCRHGPAATAREVLSPAPAHSGVTLTFKPVLSASEPLSTPVM